MIDNYRDPFKGSRGVTHGGLISPRVFNDVVYMIVRHRFGLVAENEAGSDDFEYMVAEKAELFFVGNGLINHTNLVWKSGALMCQLACLSGLG